MPDYSRFQAVLEGAFNYGVAHHCDLKGVCAIVLEEGTLPKAFLLSIREGGIFIFQGMDPFPSAIGVKGKKQEPRYKSLETRLADLAGRIWEFDWEDISWTPEEEVEIGLSVSLAVAVARNWGAKHALSQLRSFTEGRRGSLVITRRFSLEEYQRHVESLATLDFREG